jgi:hypothetical protein
MRTWLGIAGIMALAVNPVAFGRDDPPTVAPGSPFAFREVGTTSLAIDDGGKPVLVYNFGTITPPQGVPADRARACYVHPLFGLDGEVLTDDFPTDHHHHRGLFWVWPHVRVGGKEVDLWLIQGAHQRFERWIERSATADTATIAVQNGWYAGESRIVSERVTITVHRPAADGQSRPIDVAFEWTPTDQPITLEGAEGKSYGGLTLRYAPGDDTAITVPSGLTKDDLLDAPLPWADLTRTWTREKLRSGAALFIPPDHPDFPPTWLTRHYGVLCIGWPGTKPRTFPANEPIRTRYRVWVHRGAPQASAIAEAYGAYTAAPRP